MLYNYYKRIINSDNYFKEFLNTPVEYRAKIILKLPKAISKKILKKLKDEDLFAIIRYLDPDDVTDILQNLSFIRRKKILKQLNEDLRKKVSFLLKYPEDTAAGLMDLNYVIVPYESSFKDVLKAVEKHKENTGKYPVVLVEKDGAFYGELSLASFLFHKKSDKIKYKIHKIPSLKFDDKYSKVIKLFENNKHGKAVVLDEDGSVLGVIYSDDVLSLLRKEKASNLYSFASLHKEEDIFDSAISKFKNRYFWLLINLATAFLASSIVAIFKDVISAVVLLAVYMPIVAGMGGNAATQTLAVVVRGFALHGSLNKRALIRIYKNELIAAFLNALLISLFTFVIVLLFNADIIFALILCIALIGNLLVAVSAGLFIPVIMKSLGKDPATSAGIFITTLTDVFGFFFFLGLASLVFL